MVHTYLGFALDCLATVELCVFGVQLGCTLFIFLSIDKIKYSNFGFVARKLFYCNFCIKIIHFLYFVLKYLITYVIR